MKASPRAQNMDEYLDAVDASPHEFVKGIGGKAEFNC